MHDLTSMTGKAAVITGGFTGIGRATARLLVAHGARVLVFGIEEKDRQPALDDIRAAARDGGEAHAFLGDVGKPDDVDRAFREADAKLGGVDILVNNAAVARARLLEDDPRVWERMLDVNLMGYFACARAACDRMRPRGDGHIVNVGSMSADLRETGMDVYVATKAAIQAFSETLRKKVNAEGIRVTLVEPGAVATPIQGRTREQYRERLEKMEMLEPEDVAASIYFSLVQPKRSNVVMVQVRPLKQLI